MQEERLGLLGLARFDKPARNVRKERDCTTSWLEVAAGKFTLVHAFSPTSLFPPRVGIGNIKGSREKWTGLLGLSQFNKLTRNVHQSPSLRIFVLDSVDGIGQVKRLGEGQPSLFGLPRFNKHARDINYRLNSPILSLDGSGDDQGAGERVLLSPGVSPERISEFSELTERYA